MPKPERKGISILYRKTSNGYTIYHVDSGIRTFLEIQRSIEKVRVLEEHEKYDILPCILLDSAQKEIEILTGKNVLNLKFLGHRADINILRKVFLWIKDRSLQEEDPLPRNSLSTPPRSHLK